MAPLEMTGYPASPCPRDSWLAGVMIGSVIMTAVTQAMVLGAGAAIQDAAVQRR